MAAALCALACSPPGDSAGNDDGGPEHTGEATASNPRPGNLLILVADDLGTDWVGVYGETPELPSATPRIDALASQGLLFRHAWAYPVCSTARAALLTGQHAFRSGLGKAINGELPEEQVPPSARGLPEILASAGYSSAALGKWHLGPPGELTARHPSLALGFDTHRGAYSNVHDYYAWTKIIDDESLWSTTYATTDTANDVVAQLGQLPEPWLLYVAFNATHSPIQVPPAELSGLDIVDEEDTTLVFEAMVRALDTELGRIIDAVDARSSSRDTHIVFLGDNGTMPWVMRAPDPDGGKFSMRESGIAVPFIVRSPAITAPGSTTDALVSVVDVVPTLAELAGVQPASELDGRSFVDVLADPLLPGSEWVYSHYYSPNDKGPYEWYREAAREARFKLLRDQEEGEQLWDLQDLQHEAEPLSQPFTGEAAAAHAELSEVLDALGPQ